MNNQLIVLELKNFWLILENKMATIAVFPIFILNFTLHGYYGPVIATVFKLSGQIRYQKRLLKNVVFGACVCVYVCALARWAKFTFGPLQQILFQIDLSNFQYIFISIRGSHRPNLVALLLLVVPFWSHCRDPHRFFWQKCLLSRLILVLEVCNEQSAYSTCF